MADNNDLFGAHSPHAAKNWQASQPDKMVDPSLPQPDIGGDPQSAQATKVGYGQQQARDEYQEKVLEAERKSRQMSYDFQAKDRKAAFRIVVLAIITTAAQCAVGYSLIRFGIWWAQHHP